MLSGVRCFINLPVPVRAPPIAHDEFKVCINWAKIIHPSSHPKALTMTAREYTRNITVTHAIERKNISIYVH
jgi:hypothetical protein